MWGLSDGADGKGAPRGCSLNGPRTRACVSASLCRLFPRGRLAASPPPPRHRRLRPRGPHPAPTWLSSSPPSLAARQRTRRGHRSFPRDHHAGRGAPEPRLYLPRRRRGGRRAAARAPQGQSLSHRSRCPSPVREGGVGSGAPATFALRAARAATRPARRTRAATRSRTPATSTRPLLRRPGSGSLPGRRSRRRRSRRRRSGTRRLARRSRSTRRPTQSPAGCGRAVVVVGAGGRQRGKWWQGQWWRRGQNGEGIRGESGGDGEGWGGGCGGSCEKPERWTLRSSPAE